MLTPVCSVCRIRRVKADGLCSTHYRRRLAGEVDWDRPIDLPGTHNVAGENNPGHVLTEQDVVKIRKAYSEGAGNQTALAEQYGVTQAQISKIVNGKAWT